METLFTTDVCPCWPVNKLYSNPKMAKLELFLVRTKTEFAGEREEEENNNVAHEATLMELQVAMRFLIGVSPCIFLLLSR